MGNQKNISKFEFFKRGEWILGELYNSWADRQNYFLHKNGIMGEELLEPRRQTVIGQVVDEKGRFGELVVRTVYNTDYVVSIDHVIRLTEEEVIQHLLES